MELFTFVQTGGERATILCVGGVTAAGLLSTFDARRAKCSVQADRDTLLAIIEASFGDLRAFNRVVRGLRLDTLARPEAHEHEGLASTTSAAATV